MYFATSSTLESNDSTVCSCSNVLFVTSSMLSICLNRKSRSIHTVLYTGKHPVWVLTKDKTSSGETTLAFILMSIFYNFNKHIY